MKQDSLLLARGTAAKISYAAPISVGGTEYRIILDFLSHLPNKNRHIKHYEVWVTEEYLEDLAKTSPDLNGAKIFALGFIKNRF